MNETNKRKTEIQVVLHETSSKIYLKREIYMCMKKRKIKKVNLFAAFRFPLDTKIRLFVPGISSEHHSSRAMVESYLLV